MLKGEFLLRSFNRTAVWNLPKRNWLLRKLLGSMDGNPYLVQIPFHASLGCNIHVGKNFFANYNCVMMDHAPITIGDDVWIGAGAPFCRVALTRREIACLPRRRHGCLPLSFGQVLCPFFSSFLWTSSRRS